MEDKYLDTHGLDQAGCGPEPEARNVEQVPHCTNSNVLPHQIVFYPQGEVPHLVLRPNLRIKGRKGRREGGRKADLHFVYVMPLVTHAKGCGF